MAPNTLSLLSPPSSILCPSGHNAGAWPGQPKVKPLRATGLFESAVVPDVRVIRISVCKPEHSQGLWHRRHHGPAARKTIRLRGERVPLCHSASEPDTFRLVQQPPTLLLHPVVVSSQALLCLQTTPIPSFPTSSSAGSPRPPIIPLSISFPSPHTFWKGNSGNGAWLQPEERTDGPQQSFQSFPSCPPSPASSRCRAQPQALSPTAA